MCREARLIEGNVRFSSTSQNKSHMLITVNMSMCGKFPFSSFSHCSWSVPSKLKCSLSKLALRGFELEWIGTVRPRFRAMFWPGLLTFDPIPQNCPSLERSRHDWMAARLDGGWVFLLLTVIDQHWGLNNFRWHCPHYSKMSCCMFGTSTSSFPEMAVFYGILHTYPLVI